MIYMNNYYPIGGRGYEQREFFIDFRRLVTEDKALNDVFII